MLDAGGYGLAVVSLEPTGHPDFVTSGKAAIRTFGLSLLTPKPIPSGLGALCCLQPCSGPNPNCFSIDNVTPHALYWGSLCLGLILRAVGTKVSLLSSDRHLPEIGTLGGGRLS